MSILIILVIIQAATCTNDKRVVTSLKYSKYKENYEPGITKGQVANINEVPYLASLKIPTHKYEIYNEKEGKSIWKNICGGKIIDSKRVLTASHCFETNDFYFLHHPNILRYVAGDLSDSLAYTGKTVTTSKCQWRRVIKIMLHPDYMFPNHDLAIVFINTPWKFTYNIKPIKLTSKPLDYARYCSFAGYGKVGRNPRTAVIPRPFLAKISIVPSWQCSLLWDMNSFICSDSAVSNVIGSDSECPLVCNGSSDVSEKLGDVLVGMVGAKNYDKTSLYTPVSAYHSSIKLMRPSNCMQTFCY